MSTCKDCLHFDMCLLSSEKAGICKEFKDRSKFIEVPCKVGDRVYAIYTSDKTSKSYIETYGDKITQIKINKDGYHFKCWWGYFHLSDIGKTVFLVREEAEQALNKNNIKEK